MIFMCPQWDASRSPQNQAIAITLEQRADRTSQVTAIAIAWFFEIILRLAAEISAKAQL